MIWYKIRSLVGQSEELSCLYQLEDECAAMYFNIVYGAKLCRRFTTEAIGEPCNDYVLVARESSDVIGQLRERQIPLFEITS
jgi:hypothetical protein